MQVKKYLAADERINIALQRLIQESSETDGYTADMDTDASMNAVKDMCCIYTCEDGGMLTALLFVFAPGREEAEINALVHPRYRRKGCFKAMLREAAAESLRFGYNLGLFVVNSDSRDGKAVIEHWGCGTDHAELQMECVISSDISKRAYIDVTEAVESDIEELSALGAAAFGQDIESEREHIKNTLAAQGRVQYAVRHDGRLTALCAASETDGKMMIFGLGVHPDERRKGYARALLCHIAAGALQRGITKLCLEVDEENEGARALYESYGFAVTGRTEYRTFYLDTIK